MFYRVLGRILRRHAFFHLLIPLIVGVIVEALYAYYFDGITWSAMAAHLLSPHRIALYVGILAAYLVVIGVLIKSETNIGLRRIELNDLAMKLENTRSVFLVATTPFEEWFDPAAQVYLATILGKRLTSQPFQYERVLLLPSRSAGPNLNSDYLDGYHAKCLIDIHVQLGISLYFLEWREIEKVLDKLTFEEKVLIGYYPRLVRPLQWLTRTLVWPMQRRRVRRVAGGVIDSTGGSRSAFRFKKRENTVDVRVEPEERSTAFIRFVDLLRNELYDPATGAVKPKHNFTTYYGSR